MSADSYADCPRCGVKNAVREDYEQGILHGEYFVDYHAKCKECGFTHIFKHSDDLVRPLFTSSEGTT